MKTICLRRLCQKCIECNYSMCVRFVRAQRRAYVSRSHISFRLAVVFRFIDFFSFTAHFAHRCARMKVPTVAHSHYMNHFMNHLNCVPHSLAAIGNQKPHDAYNNRCVKLRVENKRAMFYGVKIAIKAINPNWNSELIGCCRVFGARIRDMARMHTIASTSIDNPWFRLNWISWAAHFAYAESRFFYIFSAVSHQIIQITLIPNCQF